MLSIKNMNSYYGPIHAVKGIDIEVPDGKIVCIIGPNGAGKSTLLKSITGVVHYTGEVNWNGTNLSQAGSRKVNKEGIIHVPEGRLLFPGLTVYKNLQVGTISWHGFLGRGSYQEDLRMVYDLFPRLEERKNQYAWSLSGGEQQMLAIGRGLMARPKLLMLDEPSMGLAPLVVADVFDKIVEVNQKFGISILLVEQNAKMALSISDYAYVIEQGRIILEGSAKEMQNDPRVISAYLGVKEASVDVDKEAVETKTEEG